MLLLFIDCKLILNKMDKGINKMVKLWELNWDWVNMVSKENNNIKNIICTYFCSLIVVFCSKVLKLKMLNKLIKTKLIIAIELITLKLILKDAKPIFWNRLDNQIDALLLIKK